MFQQFDLRRRIIIAFVCLHSILLIGTVGYRLFGKGEISWLDSLYMTVITISTVGYREVFDFVGHPYAKLFTMCIIFFGLGFLLYFLSLITALFVEGEMAHLFRRKRMTKQIDQLNKHLIICGAGKTGLPLLRSLLNEKHTFVLIESSQDLIDELITQYGEFPFVLGDATNDRYLEEAGIERAQGLITTLSNDQENLYITLSARALNKNLRIISRATDESARRKVLRAGADSVVTPDQIGAIRMLGEMLRPTVADYFESIFANPDIPFNFEEYHVTETSKVNGKKLKDLTLRDDAGILVVAIHDQKEKKYVYNPPLDTEVHEEMTLILLGEKDKLAEIESIM